MNILHIRSSSGIYGAENMILTLLSGLQNMGVGAELLCIQNYLHQAQDLYAAAQGMGLHVALLPCARRFDLLTLRSLSSWLARNPDAIIHTHDYKSLFYALLARDRSRNPVIATSHGHFASSLKQRLYNRLEVTMMRRANRVLIVSEAMRPELTARGIPDGRIALIENGIDASKYRPEVAPLARSEFDLSDEHFVYGATMRLDEQKNPVGLLRAFSHVLGRHPHARLLIAGNGPLRERIEQVADELGIAPAIRLVGARNDLEKLYPLFDCFVLPSLFEGLPLALLEAMSASVPVIATRVGHVPAVLAGTPARLVAPADEGALVAAMLDAASTRQRQPELRRRVLESFSSARMVERHLDVYHSVTGQSIHGAAH
ncbi:MAG: glycosyltransferase [Pseudoxanthomonas sp.]